ncbi:MULTISPECIES: aminoglycoside phosphotransferase family protein [Exiguobacterium]|uniref:Aminoglycoside phosphotransferase family protein n=1 Tax=Exiguobacterium antarcticum TaxID=132920 RepID=A0ABT6R3R5_9BACL|nr:MULTISPECIES: aminoglycoside phosphotransferase family protein [Exiguobacterium]MCT4779980.1 aminoglycoside phosphotransferase family protein [Exiguobacterium soli]MDI3235468.1 aminoglycoside phosphotransferase family protein [Exiguobacterium antarcticum]
MDPIEQMLREQPEFQGIVVWERIKNRYSRHPKYVLQQNGRTSIVHVAPRETFERKRAEFTWLQRMKQEGLPVPEPFAVKQLPSICYVWYGFLSGQTVKKTLPLLQETAYGMGQEAGRLLRRLHQYAAPADVNPWYGRCLDKHQRYVRLYEQGPIRLKADEAILSLIKERRHLVKGRPNHFQHDDFHLDNLITDGSNLTGVIDFSNYDFGDPWHDFVKLGLFQVADSRPFAVGQIDGYFDGDVPDVFWEVYAVYLAMALFSSLVWTQRHAPEEIGPMTARLESILVEHHHFERARPDWYTSF